MAVKKKQTDEEVKPNFEGIPPKVEKVTEELSCELNDVEWQNRARELAEANQEVAAQEQRKKDVMKELGHDVSLAKTKASKLTQIVSTKREQREVVVKVTHDYENGFVIRKRTDTGEEIGRREMTTLERQGSLLDANDFIEDAGRGKE